MNNDPTLYKKYEKSLEICKQKFRNRPKKRLKNDPKLYKKYEKSIQNHIKSKEKQAKVGRRRPSAAADRLFVGLA